MALRNNDQDQVQPQTPQGKDDDTTMEGQDLSSLMRLLYSFQEDVGATSATSSQTRTSQGGVPSPSCTTPEFFGIVDSLTLVDCKKLDLDNVGDDTFEDDGVVTDDHFQWASRSSLLQVRSRTGVRRGEEVIYSVKTKG
jgi:glucan biosynthesis protein